MYREIDLIFCHSYCDCSQMTSVGLWVLVLGVVKLCLGQDDGFDLFFVSSTSETVDYPVQFTDPLPPWLRGTLVRIILSFLTIAYVMSRDWYDGNRGGGSC